MKASYDPEGTGSTPIKLNVLGQEFWVSAEQARKFRDSIDEALVKAATANDDRYVTYVVTVEYKCDGEDEKQGFVEYINALATTIDHTPYTVSVKEVA